MRKKILHTLLLLAMTSTLCASPVSPYEARQVASHFMSAITGNDMRSMHDISEGCPFTEFYIFTSGGNDFVLVSKDDCVRPILGYSTESGFHVEQMPAHVKAWFDSYDETLRAAKSRRSGSLLIATSDDLSVANEWKKLKGGDLPQPPMDKSVSPLLTTTWDQAPYYNNLCPDDEDESDYYGNKVVTGCVATATAQLMKYHNHPATGYGSHSYNHPTYGTQSANFGTTSYDWSNMPNALTGSSTSTQVAAVATLMYHIGVADEMNYDLAANGGSGAQNYNYMGSISASSQTSLMSYFKYSPTMYAVGRDDMEADAWDALLQSELDNARPILYSGRGDGGGHSFVVDGYDSYGMFHINWGWGGYNNGYFPMGGLDPSASGIGGNSASSYNRQNVALLGVEPNNNWGVGGTVSASAVGSGSVTGAGTYSFYDIVDLTAHADEGYRFAGWDDGCYFNPRSFVMTGGDLSFNALFVPVGGDTLGYCGHGHYITGVGTSDGNTVYWGIRLPASAIEDGSLLNAVEFYACAEGTYNVVVYSGNTSPTTNLFSTSVTISSGQTNTWTTVYLSSPIALSSSLNYWLTLNSSASYPAAMTYGSGNEDGFLWGQSFTFGGWDNFSFMIRGITQHNNLGDGDTLSYCGDNEFISSLNVNVDDFAWGIMLPSEAIQSKDLLESILIYCNSTGNFTAEVYLGGTTAPGTLAHTETFSVSTTGWNTLELSSPVAIVGNNNLWIVISADDDVEYPAAICNYSGQSNSNWLRYNGDWYHLSDFGEQYIYSWMIKAVFSTLSYTVNVSASPASMGTVDGNGSYTSGSTATLLATPAEHCTFKQWNITMGSTTLSPTTNPYTLTVTADVVGVAQFEAEPKYSITVTSDDPSMGTVSGGGSFYAGETLQISASAKDGYHFDHWQDGNNDNPRTITVQAANVTYTAYFAPNKTEGIDDATHEGNIVIYATEGAIAIEGCPAGSTVQVYDAVGRRVALRQAGTSTTVIEVPSSGTYTVRFDDGTTRRVVVVR